MASLAPSKTWSTVLSGDVVTDTPKKFAEFVNEIGNVDCLFLRKEQLLKEPEEVAKAVPIATTLKIHKVKRVKDGNSSVNKFYDLSEDLEPFFLESMVYATIVKQPCN